ncbi:hypothetical protein Taro_009795 [Colocasia esculenta]|uniref:Uncharacterized protein n=1 Tax=Colocasia esculenta TaxID=4460 RepID=A0A843U178_COLES|nr:hypothetical protein [Colocasia esculenta]
MPIPQPFFPSYNRTPKHHGCLNTLHPNPRDEFRSCWGRVEEFLVAGEQEITHTKPFFFPFSSAATCTNLPLEVDQRDEFRSCWGRVEEFLVAGEQEITHTKPFFFPFSSAATCTNLPLEVDQRVRLRLYEGDGPTGRILRSCRDSTNRRILKATKRSVAILLPELTTLSRSSQHPVAFYSRPVAILVAAALLPRGRLPHLALRKAFACSRRRRPSSSSAHRRGPLAHTRHRLLPRGRLPRLTPLHKPSHAAAVGLLRNRLCVDVALLRAGGIRSFDVLVDFQWKIHLGIRRSVSLRGCWRHTHAIDRLASQPVHRAQQFCCSSPC